MTARQDYLTALSGAGYAATVAVLFEEGSGTPNEFVSSTPVGTSGSPDWDIVDGVTAGKAASVNDAWNLGASNAFLNHDKGTVLIIRKKLDTTARNSSGFGVDVGEHRCAAHMPWGDNHIYWDFDTWSSGRCTWNGYTPSTDWEAWAFRGGPSGASIWLNGVKKASHTTAVTTTLVSDDFWINKSAVTGDVQDVFFFAYVPDEVSDAVLEDFTPGTVLGLPGGDARVTHAVRSVVASADSDARVSHMVRSVVAGADPDAHVTQIVRQVIGGPVTAIAVEDSIGLAESVEGAVYDVISGDVSDALAPFVDAIPTAEHDRFLGDRPVVLARQFLDTGTENISDVGVRHPTRFYEPRVVDWGEVERAIPLPPGLPIISEATIKLTDNDGYWRRIAHIRSLRRKGIQIKTGFEGGRESLFPIAYTGELTKAVFPDGAVTLTARDQWQRWLNISIPPWGDRTNFPNQPDGQDSFFFPLIFGRNISTDENPRGQVKLFLCDTERNLWALNRTPTKAIVRLYRKLPSGDTVSIVPLAEYEKVEEDKEIDGWTFTPAYVHMFEDQPDGTELYADVDGISERGGYGTLPSFTHATVENLIDHLINLFFYLTVIDPIADPFGSTETTAWETAWHYYNDNNLLFAGCVVEPMTFGALFARMCESGNLFLYPNWRGRIAASVQPVTNPDRPVYTDAFELLSKAAGSEAEIVSSLPEKTQNQFLYLFSRNYVTNQWGAGDIYNNEADQAELGVIEPDNDIELHWVRDAATAAWVIARRAELFSLRAYQVELSVEAPKNIYKLELAQTIGITHYAGIGGPWTNREFMIYAIRYAMAAQKLILRLVALPVGITGPIPYELVEIGLGTTFPGLNGPYGKASFYWRASDYPEGTTFQWEATVEPVGSAPLAYVTDESGAFVYADLTLPDGDATPAGETVYFDWNPVGTPDGLLKVTVYNLILYRLRLVAYHNSAQYVWIDINMSNGGGFNATDQNIASGEEFRTTSDHPQLCGVPFKYEASKYQDATVFRWRIWLAQIFGSCFSALFDITDGTTITFDNVIPETFLMTGSEAFLNPTYYELPLPIGLLKDGHIYQPAIWRHPLVSIQNVFFHKARISIKSTPVKDVEVRWRVDNERMVNRASAYSRVVMAQLEVTGNDGSGVLTDCGEGDTAITGTEVVEVAADAVEGFARSENLLADLVPLDRYVAGGVGPQDQNLIYRVTP
jgi:hypothetical protein